MMVGFVRLRDLNGGRFCWVTRFQSPSVLVGYVISLMVSFQYQSFFYYEISNTVNFGGLRDLSDGRFWWGTRSQ